MELAQHAALSGQLAVVCTSLPPGRGPSKHRAAVHVDMSGGHRNIPVCPVQHTPPVLTHGHRQVRALRLAGGAYYSLLVFLSV